MGRGKLKLELIANEKSRQRAFEKTTKVLMNKCREFSRREVDVCMIIINGDGEHTYPKQTEEVDRIIQRYLTATKDKPPRKVTGLSEILFSNMAHQKKQIIDSSELSKLYIEADDELIIDQYCPNGDSNEFVRFIDLLDEKIKQVELMIHAKKLENYQLLDYHHNYQFHGHDDHHVNHDHGLNFDHQVPHYPIDPSLNTNNVQFVSNPGYQNYASEELLSSNYNYIDQYHQYDQGYNSNNNHISGTGPLVEDPTVFGMLEEDCWMFGNNINDTNDDYRNNSTPSSMTMPRQYYPDQPQQQHPPSTIMPPPYQYASMPLQLPEIPLDHHHQQQMHGGYDYNDKKGKRISDEYIQ